MVYLKERNKIMDKEYKNIEDLLPEGQHLIEVVKSGEFDKEGKLIPNSHRSGTFKTGGKWYMYRTKINDEWITVFADEFNKRFFDTGKVLVKIVPKRMKGIDTDLFDANGKKLLKAFYNEVPKEISGDYKEEELDIDDIPM